MRIKSPRMSICLLLAICLFAAVYAISPQQGPVIAYKLSLITLSAFSGYWIDRWAFPYARPHATALSPASLAFIAAQIRRAIIMGSTMLAVGVGL